MLLNFRGAGRRITLLNGQIWYLTLGKKSNKCIFQKVLPEKNWFLTSGALWILWGTFFFILSCCSQFFGELLRHNFSTFGALTNLFMLNNLTWNTDYLFYSLQKLAELKNVHHEEQLQVLTWTLKWSQANKTHKARESPIGPTGLLRKRPLAYASSIDSSRSGTWSPNRFSLFERLARSWFFLFSLDAYRTWIFLSSILVNTSRG